MLYFLYKYSFTSPELRGECEIYYHFTNSVQILIKKIVIQDLNRGTGSIWK